MCWIILSRYPNDHFENTRIVGEKQAEVAKKLFEEAQEQVTGKISYKQTYVDMSSLPVLLSSGESVTTCPAAVGFSFAAGTTDGPGAFDFTQGDDQVYCIPYTMALSFNSTGLLVGVGCFA